MKNYKMDATFFPGEKLISKIKSGQLNKDEYNSLNKY